MKEKDKDKKTGLPDFLNYRGNNLSGNEKNSFEKELQKDPFAAEAEEGFSAVDPSHLSRDIADLEKRLASRTGIGRRFVWYQIAASVAVLMVIATVFFIVQKDSPSEIASADEKKEVTFEIQKPEALKDNATSPAPAIAFNEVLKPEEKSPAKVDKRLDAAGAGKMKTEEVILTDTTESEAVEMISAAAEQKKAEAAIPLDLKMPAAARSAVKSQELRIVRGKVFSSEDNLPIPGVNIVLRGTTLGTATDSGGNFALSIPEKTNPDLIANFIGMKTKEFNPAGDSLVRVILDPDLMALDEVVVVGYGVSADENKAYDNPTYTAAEPVTGKSAFNKYIDQNLRRPDGGKQKEVVVLSFTVKLNGQPSNIKVVRSPGKQFSDEATRLILDGPEWKPASENGVNIEDEVRVRIIFK